MKHFVKLSCVFLLTGLLCMTNVGSSIGCNPIVAEAHSGRTDSSGGHRDNKNASGLGSYHYHCGGYPAHLHTDGICPYSTAAAADPAPVVQETSTNSTSSNITTVQSSSTKNTSSNLVKQVQTKLNTLGYDCGTVDGISGKKTKAALKAYQKDNGLIVDGIIGKQVKGSMGIA